MVRRVVCLCLALGLVAEPSLYAQALADAEVAKGIKEVEDGDLDAAIFTLDAAARRLTGDPARTRDLAQAYLYLAIAYLGKGHETLTKARFKDALTHDKDLSLSPEKFAPRVLELFEKAKEELGRSDPAEAAAPAQAEKKKGGSKKGLVLLGVGGAAAAGILVASGGGKASAGGAETASRTTTTLTGRVTLSNVLGEFNNEWRILVAGTGQLEATLTWNEPNAIITMQLHDERGPGNPIVRASNTGSMRVQLSASVTPKTYMILIVQCGVPLSLCQTAQSRDAATYTLTVVHP